MSRNFNNTNLTNNNLQANKTYASLRFSSANSSPISNSLYFVSQVAQTIYLNVMIASFDNANIATNLTNIAGTGIINFLRIG